MPASDVVTSGSAYAPNEQGRLPDERQKLKIDEAILANVGTHWRKVAMVIALASEKCSKEIPEKEDDLLVIAAHLEILVHEGKLLADGDVSNWRHSEVRQP